MPRAKARKMVNLDIEETSGVDHPAHLHEGWLVMKAVSNEEVEKAMPTLTDDEEMSPVQSANKEVPMDDMDEMNRKEEDAKTSYEDMEMALKKAEERIAELEEMYNKATTKAEDMETEEEDDELPEFLRKEAPEEVRKAFESMQKAVERAREEKAVAEEVLRKERAERADADAVVKARESFASLGIDPELVGPALRQLSETAPDLAKSLDEVLKAANAKVESADIFTEIGGNPRALGSAYEKATAMAKAAVSDGKAGTLEQAVADVFMSNPALYDEYLNEQKVSG
jgi:hypothetical protein